MSNIFTRILIEYFETSLCSFHIYFISNPTVCKLDVIDCRGFKNVNIFFYYDLGLNYLKSNNLTRQMDENERIMSFNHFIDQGKAFSLYHPSLITCIDVVFIETIGIERQL